MTMSNVSIKSYDFVDRVVDVSGRGRSISAFMPLGSSFLDLIQFHAHAP